MPRKLPITSVVKAAALLAEDVPTAEVARRFGVSERTIYDWSRSDEGRETIAAIKANVREGVKHLPIANLTHRVHVAQDLLDGVLGVVAERAAAGKKKADTGWDAAMTGERTGHVAVKQIGVGRSAVREGAFDGATIAAAVKLMEYVERATGQEQAAIVNVRHSGTVRHVARDYSRLSDDELDSLIALAEKVDAGEGAG